MTPKVSINAQIFIKPHMIVVSAGHTYTHNIHTSKKAIIKQKLIVCEKECPASASAAVADAADDAAADAAARSYQKFS